MSHFAVEVMIPRDTQPENVHAVLEEILAPYSENLSVPEYEKKCHCVGWKAKGEAGAAMIAQLGPWDAVRAAFRAKHPELAEHHEFNEKSTQEQREQSQRVWKTEFVDPRRALEAKLFAEHPLRDAGDPGCEDCKGSGIERTTYNPKSKWDWWCIGGRWTGMVGGYDPVKDPLNYQTCFLCGGTGKRDDERAREWRAQDPSFTCNGCRGTGRELKFSTGWRQIGNVAPIGEVVAKMRAGVAEVFPYAFITPDGEWHERGQMGWFGMGSNEQDPAAWRKQVLAEFEKQPDCLVVVVDCHI